MKITNRGLALLFCLFLFLFSLSSITSAFTKGIYITQSIFEERDKLDHLIAGAKKAGIDTFIIDLETPSKIYQKHIDLVKSNNIQYIARIIMYPNGGGKEKEIISEAYWEKKYILVKQAIAYGAQQIQLDYIRYDTKQGGSKQHAINIHKIIQWYKERLAKANIPLQVDVFGISSFGEEIHIGQNIHLFSDSVNAICPMVYPSHFEPFRAHAVTPYDTVYDSLIAIKEQFDDKPLPFKLIPYIELSNYRYPLSQQKKLDYIRAQIKAAHDAGADGWYAWSPHNLYDNLFQVLENSKG